MASHDQDAAFERMLSTNLVRAVDWLKYGEAKNAALLAFASAWLAVTANLLVTAHEKQMPASIAVLLFAAELLFLLGAGQAIAGLLPKTDPREFEPQPRKRLLQKVFGRHRTAGNNNLLFFGYIRDMSAQELKQAMEARYYPEPGKVLTEDYVTDLCDQAVITSQIAQQKADSFWRGMLFVFLALVLLMLTLLLALLRVLP
jgi:hypothetical protein